MQIKRAAGQGRVLRRRFAGCLPTSGLEGRGGMPSTGIAGGRKGRSANVFPGSWSKVTGIVSGAPGVVRGRRPDRKYGYRYEVL